MNDQLASPTKIGRERKVQEMCQHSLRERQGYRRLCGVRTLNLLFHTTET